MRLYTPDGLYYPITVTRLLREPKQEVQAGGPLFGYEYKHKVIEGSKENPEGSLVERTWPATFESELEGKLVSLDVHPGQVITRKTLVAEIEEACTHEVQFAGMCANCGKDMKETTYNTTLKASDRAKINTVHDRDTLLISQHEASREDEDAKRRLLGARKLTLVVDLDQTVIQACVEATVGEWLNDPSHPNHEALKDVYAFNISTDNKTYYLKPRPGLTQFLETISQMYEMHIYTMATREYAAAVASKIDPGGKLFGGRILSRNENGEYGDKEKNLKRLFPVDTKMIVIIDDRADVWHWSPNLVKVKQFDFFVGIGDINSSFLPKRQDQSGKSAVKPADVRLLNPDGTKKPGPWVADDYSSRTSPGPPVTPVTPSIANGNESAVDRMVAMAGEQDESTLQAKQEEHDKALDSQLADRPLLQKQKILDAANVEAATSPAVEAAAEILAEADPSSSTSGSNDTALDHSKYRHNLLADDDNELETLTQNLKKVHAEYFAAYDASLPDSSDTGRVAELKPGKPTSKRSLLEDLRVMPDTAAVMNSIKAHVFKDCSFVLSGIVPLGTEPTANEDIFLAKTFFGATFSENINKKTTHLIASPDRKTAKVRQAARKGLWVVGLEWIRACYWAWRKVNEAEYAIHGGVGALEGSGGELPSFQDKQDGEEGLSDSDPEAVITGDEGEGAVGDGKTEEGVEDPQLKLELEKVGPSMNREDSSPTATEHADNWEELNDEMKEFLGSDAEDSDVEGSVKSDASTTSTTPKGGKRKRDADGESEEEEGNVNGEKGSRLQKRKKKALGRTSSLNKIAAVSEKVDGAVAIEDGLDEAACDEAEQADAEEGEDDDDGDDLEAALAAEMERQDEEDREDAE